MLPGVERTIRNGGEAIKCDAVRDGAGHVGRILHVVGKEKRVLGHTDNRYETAEEAVRYMEETVAQIRGDIQKKAADKSSAKKKGDKS